MFKSMTMLAGGALGVSMAVTMGAPSPHTLLSDVTRQAASVAAATAAAPASSCVVHWGSQAKTSQRAEGPSTARITDVRVGQHSCYDRLVIDLGPGAKPGYSVRYLSAIRAQGSGQVIPVRGRARLEITVRDNAAPGFPAAARELADVSGFGAFRQLAGAGSFEGCTEMALGVRTTLPFRVSLLSGPGRGSRLVIDVAHRR